MYVAVVSGVVSWFYIDIWIGFTEKYTQDALSEIYSNRFLCSNAIIVVNTFLSIPIISTI